MKHVGAFVSSGGTKYIIVRTEGSSNVGNVTVYHVDGNTLVRINSNRDYRWPKLFYGFEPCHCTLTANDISPAVREAVGLVGTVTINSHMGGHHADGDMGGMYNHMGDVMMHGGHHADGDMGGMYNRMDSKFSGSSNPAAGFSRGAAGFTDMA